MSVGAAEETDPAKPDEPAREPAAAAEKDFAATKASLETKEADEPPEPEAEPPGKPSSAATSTDGKAADAARKPPSEQDEETEETGEEPNDEREAPPVKAPADRAPRSRWSKRVGALLAVLVVVSAGYLIWRSRQTPPLPPPPARADILDAVPTAPFLLVTVDLDALRGSKLGALLATQEGPGVLGRVRATCGFEPIDSLKEIALVVPASSDDADFGLVAVGDVSQAAIVECAEKVIVARNGKPVSTNVGSFRSVRDASATSGEIAVRSGGPLLVGAGNFLRTMVDTADGALPTVRTDQAHAALRAAISDATLARASIVLSARQRATIADEVTRSRGRAPEALTSVLAAALGVKVSPETVQLHAVILVDGAEHAQALGDAFEGVKKERADDPLLRALGFGQLLDRVRIRIEGTQIHLNLEVTITEAELLADKLGAARAEAPPAGSAPPPLPSAKASSDPARP